MHRRQFLTAMGIAAVTASGALSACSAKSDSVKTSGVMRVAAAGNAADALDLGSTTGVATSLAAVAIWENLVALTDKGIELRLAETITPRDDSREWLIKLRRSLFHDSSTVTANDVLASLKAIAASPNFSNAYIDVDFTASRVDGDTVVLRLHRPRADLIEGVLSQASPVMLRGDATNKIGAGPFRYKSGDSQSGFVLDRFADYFDGAPRLSGLQIRRIDDGDARIRAVEDGGIDYATDVPGTAKLSKATPIDLGLGSAIAYSLELNTRMAPFDDPEIREAARLVIDRPRLVELALGNPGIVGNDLVGIDLPGYAAEIPQRQRDLTKAREIFARKKINALELHSAEIYAGMSAASEAMINQFAEAGVTLAVKKVDAESYYNNVDELKKHNMFVTYYLNRPVAATLPFQTAADSTWNLNGFTSPEYQTVLNRAMSTANKAERTTVYDDAQKILHEHGATVVWGFKKRIDAANTTVNGVGAIQGLPVFGKATVS